MLKFFNNIINNEIDSSPNKLYRNLQQEFINMQWDNTTALYTVQEQEDIGSRCYKDLNVWLVPTVADTSTGLKIILALLYSNIYEINSFNCWKFLRAIYTTTYEWNISKCESLKNK